MIYLCEIQQNLNLCEVLLLLRAYVQIREGRGEEEKGERTGKGGGKIA